MSIQIKNSSIVYPALDTPRKSLWLSRIDMMIRSPYSHTHVFYVYHHPTTINGHVKNNNNNNASSSNFFDTHIMKESLSKVLVPFYPVAGRLKFNVENGRYEIECNAQGALFIEAEAPTHTIADFGDYSSPNTKLRKLVFPTIDYSGGLSSFPLLVVQLTRFKCGGVCLGILTHHHVGDGNSQLHFTNSWARLAKGLDLSVYPVHDRAKYLAPRHPSQIKFQHLEYVHPSLFRKEDSSGNKMTTMECVFKLTKSEIDALKLQAVNSEKPSYELSAFSVLAGHVWRNACKARGLAGDQDIRLYMLVDGRSRLKDTTIPQGYFGNVLFYAICVEKARDVIYEPLWYAATKIQQAIKKMEDAEYLRSAIDYLESHPDPDSLVRSSDYVTCPNFIVNSWSKLPFREGDFGWAGPQFTNIGGVKYDGQTYLMSSIYGDGSFSVAIKLLTPHMTLFKKYLYDF